MDLGYSTPGEMQISMIPYVNDMFNEFSEKIAGTTATHYLFEVRKSMEAIK